MYAYMNESNDEFRKSLFFHCPRPVDTNMGCDANTGIPV